MAEFNEEFDEIKITEINQRVEGWTFLVSLGHGDSLIEYLVEVDKEFWAYLTGRRVEPVKLVEATFKFLLDKEPKELILRKFNLSDVSGNFPRYELDIKRMI